MKRVLRKTVVWIAAILTIAVVVETTAMYLGYLPYGSEAVPIGVQVGAATLTLIRTPIHPFLAEYQREIEIIQHGSEPRRLMLSADTGGTVQINMYKGDLDVLFLVDRIAVHVVRLMAGSVEEFRRDDPVVRDQVSNSEYIGALDHVGQGSSRTFRFISPQERREIPVEIARSG